jgi:CheY-like chemotaxis protein
MGSWARELKTKVEPALKETRALATQVRQIRPALLVVDDDEVMRDILKPVLISLGYDVVLVGSGDQALRELTQMQPDALLLDIRLQDCDGVTLTRQLKSRPHLAHIPVILMSGDSRRERLMSSIEAGAVDFIAKPFTREVLRVKLEKVLGRTVPA